MRNKLAKIYVTEMKRNKYMVYMAVDDYMYGLGIYKYAKSDETWKTCDVWLTEGQAQQHMYRSMVVGMARMGETIAELASGTLQEPVIWDVRGERTVCAVEINIIMERGLIVVQAPHTEWSVAIESGVIQNAHEAARELCLAGAPQWAAHYAITVMRRWDEIMKQREREAENGRES